MFRGKCLSLVYVCFSLDAYQSKSYDVSLPTFVQRKFLASLAHQLSELLLQLVLNGLLKTLRLGRLVSSGKSVAFFTRKDAAVL